MTKLQRNRRKTIKLSPAQIFLACILSSTWRFSLSSLEVLSVSTWRWSWHKPAFHWRGWAGTNRSRSPTEMQHFYSGCISRWASLIRLYFQVRNLEILPRRGTVGPGALTPGRSLGSMQCEC